MHKRYQFCFIRLMDPFQDSFNIEDYKRKLGMQHATTNVLGKIWAFIDLTKDYSVISNEE